MTIKNVGLIGVGLMGHGIGKNILAKGFALNVMAHKNRAPVESLVSLGAKEYASPAEIAKASDLVILCVTGTPQVEEAIYGAKGSWWRGQPTCWPKSGPCWIALPIPL